MREGGTAREVTEYQFDKNTHTDSHFLQEALSQMEKSKEETILVTDGGYDGQMLPEFHGTWENQIELPVELW